MIERKQLFPEQMNPRRWAYMRVAYPIAFVEQEFNDWIRKMWAEYWSTRGGKPVRTRKNDHERFDEWLDAKRRDYI